MQSSFFGGDTGLTYEDLQRRREMAILMNRRGANDRPARNIWEGLNSAAKSVSGALLANKMGGEMKNKEDAFRETLASTGMDPQMMALMENMSLPQQQAFALRERQAQMARDRKPAVDNTDGTQALLNAINAGRSNNGGSSSQTAPSLPFPIGTTDNAPTGGDYNVGVPMASMQPPVVSSSNSQSVLSGLYQNNLQPPNSFAPPSAESQTALLGDMADPALSSVSPQAYRKPMPPPDATPVNGFDISSAANHPLSFGQLDRQQAPAPQQDTDALSKANALLSELHSVRSQMTTKKQQAAWRNAVKQTQDEILFQQGQAKYNSELAGDAGPDVKGEGDLRKELQGGGTYKDMMKMKSAFGKIKQSVKQADAAGDMALVFNFMKMLDPGSTVREGEYATAKNAASVGETMRAIWNSMLDGSSLTDEHRMRFLKRSGMMYNAQVEGFNSEAERYRGLSEAYGYEPDRVVQPMDERSAIAAFRADGTLEHHKTTPKNWNLLTDEERINAVKEYGETEPEAELMSKMVSRAVSENPEDVAEVDNLDAPPDVLKYHNMPLENWNLLTDEERANAIKDYRNRKQQNGD